MELGDIQKIGIVGAGTMGQGIAQVSALNGYQVVLFDIHNSSLVKAKLQIENNLDKGIERGKLNAQQKESALSKINFTNEIDHLVVDFVIEAIIEKLEPKQDLFKRLEESAFRDIVYNMTLIGDFIAV